MGRAGPAQAQPIEVRGFGVTGPGPAGPPSLANPHIGSGHQRVLKIGPDACARSCSAAETLTSSILTNADEGRVLTAIRCTRVSVWTCHVGVL